MMVNYETLKFSDLNNTDDDSELDDEIFTDEKGNTANSSDPAINELFDNL
jgi:hypothetical protein